MSMSMYPQVRAQNTRGYGVPLTGWPAARYSCISYSQFGPTPSLVDPLEFGSFPPVDDYLLTPNVADWREIQHLEYEKDRRLTDEAQRHSVPSLEFYKQEPVERVLTPGPPAWPYDTIAPKDVFSDYAEVLQYLQREQEHRSPPSAEYYPVSENVCGSSKPTRPTPVSPARCVGEKAKRGLVDEDEDDDFTSKPPRLPSPDAEENSDDDQADDDFHPIPPRPVKRRRLSPVPPTRSRTKAAERPAAPKQSTSQSNCGDEYPRGPCSCQRKSCKHCSVTCFYTFTHGVRKGEVCQRIFPSTRHLDLKRHEKTHASQEERWLSEGVITHEEAWWFVVKFEKMSSRRECPNPACHETFSRSDALARHVRRKSCWRKSLDSGNNRGSKSKALNALCKKQKGSQNTKKKA